MDYKHKLTPALATKMSNTETDKHFEVTDSLIDGFKFKHYLSGTMTFSLMYTAPDGRRLRYTMGCYPALSVPAARKLAEQLYAQVKLGRDIQREKQTAREMKPVPTLGSFINDTYLPWFISHYKAPKAKLPFNQFQHLFSKRLDKVTTWDIESWRSKRHKEGLSASTSNRYIGTLKAMFNRAVDWEIVDQNPIAKVKKQKSDSRAIIRYLSLDEEERLRGFLRSRDRRLAQSNPFYAGGRFVRLEANLGGFPDHIQPMVLLLINTGIRRGEMFNLRWQDVDLDKRTLHIPLTKTNIPRTIPLTSLATSILAERIKASARPSDQLFPIMAGSVSQAFERACKRSKKLHNLRFHDLRHEATSRLFEKGLSPMQVATVTGHRDFQMLNRYTHLRAEDIVAVI